MPNQEKLKSWFKSYPDGFGIAFPHQGRVRLLKGAMNSKQMMKLVRKTSKLLDGEVDKAIVVIQYRKAVTGSVCPRFCHPFPVSANQKELDSLNVLTDCALAHNGVISEYSTWGYSGQYMDYGFNDIQKTYGEDINDAQEFIKDYLVGMGQALFNPNVQKLIQAHTSSKFALLTNKTVWLIGEFVKDDGYYYSNGGYKPCQPVTAGTSEYGKWLKEHPASPKAETLPNPTWNCWACESPAEKVYQLEDDNGVLCADCFRQYVGREPVAMEEAC